MSRLLTGIWPTHGRRTPPVDCTPAHAFAIDRRRIKLGSRSFTSFRTDSKSRRQDLQLGGLGGPMAMSLRAFAMYRPTDCRMSSLPQAVAIHEPKVGRTGPAERRWRL